MVRMVSKEKKKKTTTIKATTANKGLVVSSDVKSFETNAGLALGKPR